MTLPSPSDLVTLRTFPQITKKRLSFATRTPVYTAVVSGSPPLDSSTLGLWKVTYLDGVGELTDVKPGMTLDIGTAPGGRDIGSVRIRKAPTANEFFISENAPGRVPIEDGHYLTVVEEYRIWQILPRLKGTTGSGGYTTNFIEYHDYDVVYTNQNKIIDPIVNIYGQRAGWVDPGEEFRTVHLAMGYQLMSVGSTLTSILWDVKDGTITVGEDSDQIITVQFPDTQVFRYITCTVTDSLGGTFTRVFEIWVHNSANPPFLNFSVESDETDDGRRIRVDVFGEDEILTIDDLAPGMACCYWEEPEFDDDTIPEEYRREFYGWLTTETSKAQKYQGTVELEIASPAHHLDLLSGQSQTINNKATPVSWYDLHGLTIDRAVHYLLRRYSTSLTVINLELPGDTVPSLAETISKDSVWEQLKYLISGYCGHAACTSSGTVKIVYHYSFLEMADRTLRGVWASLTKSDWVDSKAPSITLDYTDRIGQVAMDGSTMNNAGENALLASRAPGLTPGPGTGVETAPFQRLPIQGAQEELNRRAGHHWAWVTSPYQPFTIDLVANMDVFEVAGNIPVTLTWSEEHPRGIEILSEEFVIQKVNISHSNDLGSPSKTVSLTLKRATFGLPGQKYVYPKSSFPRFDPLIITPFNIMFPDLVLPPFSLWDWGQFPPEATAGKFFALGYSTKAYRGYLTSIDPVTVLWEDISTGLSGDLHFCAADPTDYRRRYVVGTSGIFVCDNIWSDPVQWTLIKTTAELFTYEAGARPSYVVMDSARPGWIAIIAGTRGIAISFDYGVTWTLSAVDGSAIPSAVGDTPYWSSIAVSQHNTFGHGRLYAISAGAGLITRSEDWGLTWEWIGNPGGWPAATLHVPHLKTNGDKNTNAGLQEVLHAHGHGWGFGQAGSIKRSYTQGFSWTTLASHPAGNLPSGAPSRNAIVTNPFDPLRIYLAITDASAPALYGGGVAKSIDGGYTWQLMTPMGAGNVLFGGNMRLSGFPTDPDFLLACSTGLYAYGWGGYLSDTRGFADPGSGVARITFNGGVTWSVITPPAPGGFISYIDADLSDFIPPVVT